MLPKSANTSLRWSEPLFFKLRSSTRLGWIVRAAVIVAVYGLLLVLLFVEKRPPEWPEPGPAKIILVPAAVGIMILFLFELPNAQRTVELTDKEISCFGMQPMAGGLVHLLTGMAVWNRREIQVVRLLRPGEPGNRFSFGLMTIARKYGRPKQLAVPRTVRLEDVADHLHSMDVAVELSGWPAVVETAPAH
jgi:hypothetical protein